MTSGHANHYTTAPLAMTSPYCLATVTPVSRLFGHVGHMAMTSHYCLSGQGDTLVYLAMLFIGALWHHCCLSGRYATSIVCLAVMILCCLSSHEDTSVHRAMATPLFIAWCTWFKRYCLSLASCNNIVLWTLVIQIEQSSSMYKGWNKHPKWHTVKILYGTLNGKLKSGCCRYIEEWIF